MAYNFRAQTEAIVNMLERIKENRYVYLCDLNAEVYVTPEPVSYEERYQGNKKIVSKGEQWGNAWECGWFHLTIKIPASAKGNKVVLYMDIGGELCFYDENGVAIQGLSSGSVFAVENERDGGGERRWEYVLTECARGDELIELWADAGANPIIYAGSTEKAHGKILLMDLCICRDNVKQLWYDASLLYGLMLELPEDSARYHRLRQSLFEAVNELYEFTDEEVEKAIQILKKELDKKCGDSDLKFTGIGHSHIDLAWLWPIRETKRKGVRTFANSLRNMERYPEYKFGASQPQLYEWVKELQPELMQQIKDHMLLLRLRWMQCG